MNIHEIFKLDLLSFVTLSSLLWEAAIKATRIEFKLLTDINMLLFYEKGIRAGITRAIRHYAKTKINKKK